MRERVEIQVISSVHIYFRKGARVEVDEDDNEFVVEYYIGEVYDRGMRRYGESDNTEDVVRKNVLQWVYDNYNCPINLDDSDLLYFQPEDLE